jgi:cathepsin B
MSAKIAFVAFLVLVTGALGQSATRYPIDFVYESAPFIDVINYARDQHRSVYDTKTDILQFAEGFLNGVGSASVFDEIKVCIGDGESIITDITTGIEDIKSKNAAQVKTGIQLLGQAAQILPNAAKACNAGVNEIKTLVKMVESFQSPIQFLYYVGKSLIINHVDVLNEVSQAITAYEDKNFNQLGYWIGKAMDTILLGNPESVQDIKTNIVNFAEGFLNGIETAQLFQEIEACIGDSETFVSDVTSAIGDIKSKDPARVKTGILLLGEAAQIIPTAAQACKAADADVTTLVKLVETFQSPESFLYYIGKSLIINHVEVINEVSQAVDSYDVSNYNQLGYWVGKAMDTIVLGETVEVQDTKSDILNFVEGLLAGIGSAQAFDQVKACVTDSEDVIGDIASAVADIESKDPSRVKSGIQLIGQAAQIIPDAVQECKAGLVDLKTLLKMVESFKSPISFLYYIGKSLLINHVEVLNEVGQAVAGYEAGNFTQLGYWVGAAMDTVILGDDQTLTQDFVDHVNKVSTWKAGLSPKFEGMTLREIKGRFLGANLVDNNLFDNITVYDYEGAVADVPSYFNASEQWPGCIHPIRDQGQCGSCWAFAASEVLSDRTCIASNGTENVVLSPQYLLSCNNVLDHGCNGGTPLFSWWFIGTDGLVTDACLPYESYNGTQPLKCKDFTACADGTPLKKYYGKSPASLNNPASIQANLMQYGPVEAAMTVYQDFMTYQGGVYVHTSGSELGGHAIKITGWGTENGTNYWIVANSWGASWGENGFFRIAWGQCGIDSACVAGQADLSKNMMSENRIW